MVFAVSKARATKAPQRDSMHRDGLICPNGRVLEAF
jgi:hypothetical protein